MSEIDRIIYDVELQRGSMCTIPKHEFWALVALARIGAGREAVYVEGKMTPELTRLKDQAQKEIERIETGTAPATCEPGEYAISSKLSFNWHATAAPELILSLIARLERAEEALKPFANVANEWGRTHGDAYKFTLMDLRRAQAHFKSNPMT